MLKVFSRFLITFWTVIGAYRKPFNLLIYDAIFNYVHFRNEELITEIKELKERNKFLEKDNDSLYEQLNQLKSQVSTRVTERSSSDSLSFIVSDLQNALKENESRLKCCMSAYEELKTETDQQREMYLQRIEELTRKLEKSNDH